MATTERNCENCKFIQGDECYLYTGPTMEDCSLVTGQWYNIEELITALKCAGFSTTTTSSSTSGQPTDCDSCICLLVEGYNNIYGQLGNASAVFTYRLYKDAAKQQLLLERTIGPGVNNVYTHFGSIGFNGPIYQDIFVNVITENGEEFTSFGDDVDLIISVNNIIVYARSIAVPVGGLNVFPSLPPVAIGRIKIMLFSNRFDTNINEGQGLVAVGGSPLSDSIFTINTNLLGGGMVGSPELSWPNVIDNNSDFVYTNFDVDHFGSSATGMQIVVTGSNNEVVPLRIEYSFSADPSLDFSDILSSGATYEKTVNLSRDQAIENDVLIRILK